MTHTFDGYNYLVRLQKGELLIEKLTKLVKQENIKGAWLSGLGGALWAELGFYQLETKEYEWKRLEKLLEITSLQGNVAWVDSEPMLHIHGSFSDENMQGFGGHVKELAVAGTCEVFLHMMQRDELLTRSEDSDIGLKLLGV
jgi:predicted DNA-binding protein with PD1-like motif